MRVIIIEDEQKASDRLTSILTAHHPSVNVLATIESVADSVQWLRNNPHPDLIFMDIQLADGLSFEIFKHVEIAIPVIFITAFDQFAIEAFKVNSIAYILKPFQPDDIDKAIQKFTRFFASREKSHIVNYLEGLQALSGQFIPNYKNRFFVSLNKHSFSIPVTEIAYFIHEDKSVILVNTTGRRFVVNYTLETLESLVDPRMFFRINRSLFIQINSIKKITNLSTGRINLDLDGYADNPVTVSRSKTSAFKNWLDQ